YLALWMLTYYFFGCDSILSTVALGVLTQPDALYAVPNGTTTGPELPLRPLWMCAAVGFAMPLTPLKSQQVLPFVASRWITASPLPFGSPFTGASFEPLSLAETTGLIDWPPASANAGTSSADTASARTLRMTLLSSFAP